MPQPSFDDALCDLSFVAFDTETTGLSAGLERIVELSAVRFRFDGSEVASFDELIDPGRPIPAGAARVHGINDSMVKGKPAAEAILPGFVEFVQGSVLLAHNADFDLGFLAHEAARANVTMPELPVLDTVDISRRLRSDLPNHKLETISKALGCEASTYHRALADAQTLSQAFLRLLGSDYAEKTLGALVKDTGPALTFGAPDRVRLFLPPALKAIDTAMQSGGKVTIAYRPEGKREEGRDVVPQGYMRRPTATFLMARCEPDGVDRSFRVDWITRAHMAQASLF